MKRKQGFTIVEIVVAMVLLGIAGVLLATSVRTAGLLRVQAQSWQNADEALGQTLADAAAKESGTPKTVTLTDGTKTLTASGVTDSDIGAVWVNVPSLEDSLFRFSQVLAQEPPDPLAEPQMQAPADKPTKSDEIQTLMDANYFENGAFSNSLLNPPPKVALGCMDTPLRANRPEASVSQKTAGCWLRDGASLSNSASLVFTEEFLYLGGNIILESQGDAPAPAMLVSPASGHGQPALVYVAPENGINITWTKIVEGAEPAVETVNWPQGWYAVPANTDLAGLHKYGLQENADAWAVLCGKKADAANFYPEGKPENGLTTWTLDENQLAALLDDCFPENGDFAQREAAQNAVDQALDSAFARLRLAGIYSGLYQ